GKLRGAVGLHARWGAHRFDAPAQIRSRPARGDAGLGQRRAGVDSADPGVGVRAAEKRDVQEARAIEGGHVARATGEEAAGPEAWDPGADHEDWRGRGAPSNTSPSGSVLRTRASSETSPRTRLRQRSRRSGALCSTTFTENLRGRQTGARAASLIRRLPVAATRQASRPRPPAATSTCCRVFPSRWHSRAAALLDTPPDLRR